MDLTPMIDGAPGRDGRTVAELARHYHRTAETIRTYLAADGAPAPTGRRGRWNEYDPQQVEVFLRSRFLPALDPAAAPAAAMTLKEAAAYAGIAYVTARSYLSRGQWPEPDETDTSGQRLWRPATIDAFRATRKRRTTPGHTA